jgi:hypothetical protein
MTRNAVYLLAAMASFAISSARAADVDRFRLFQSEYPFTNAQGETFWLRALFKLDTVTGDIFICESIQLKTDRGIRQQTKCRPFEVVLDAP